MISDGLKETNVDWIPTTPSHWSLRKAKFLFFNKSIKNRPDQPLLSVTQSYGVIRRDESETKVWNPEDDVSSYKLVEANDFVISLRSFEGGLELSSVSGLVSPAYTVLGKIQEIHPKYFWRLMKSSQFITELNKNVTGIRQGKNIGWDDFSNIYLPLPPIEEQRLISRYLDKKTQQIDTLIEKIEKKIELLKEQRTSLINHYVTKGLDPNVEMKESGVEWIGKIPKHWDIKRLKYIGERKSGDGFRVELQGNEFDEIPFYKVSDLNLIGNEKYLTVSNNYLSKQVIENEGLHIFPKDSIVFPKIGEALKLRKRRITSTTCCIDNNMMALMIQSNNDDVEFLYLTLSLVDFSLYCSSGTVPSISETQVGTIPIPVPPVDEQKRIAGYLSKHLGLLDSLVSSEARRCSLAEEYRQSLISSVVTGKVRVTEDMV